MDSGSSQHLCKSSELFSSLDESADKIKILVADGTIISSQGKGNVYLYSKTKDGVHEICFQDVYYLPQLECNLLSVKRITEKGFIVNFDKNNCIVMKENTVYLEAISNENNLYKVITYENENNQNYNFAYNCKNHNCISLWHKRLGHRNINAIKQLVNEKLADGIQIDHCQHSSDCTHCIKNKLSELPYPKEIKHKASRPLDIIHSDLCGPMETQSVSGKHYFLTFIDEYSRYSTIYLLTKKNEVYSKLREYVAMTRNKFGKTLKVLRSDNGGEYIGNEVEKYLKEQGIVHQLTVPYSPQQNGISERKNRSLIEMTRCLLSEANLPQKFWAEAVLTANYLQNRLPTKAVNKTPYELWTNRKPDLSNIRTFGSRAFAYVHKSKRGKLDEKAIEGILIGYDQRSKGYRIYVSDHQVIISRTVKFIEDDQSQNLVPVVPFPQVVNPEVKEENEDEQDDSTIDESVAEPRRSNRANKGKPPERLIYLATENKNDPESFKELHSRSDKSKWLEAIDEEMESLKKNHTWDLVELPKGRKAIGCKWTFKAKRNEHGMIERYKARLVAKGYNQKFGTEYEETFAPVVKHTTIRAFLTTACYKKMLVKHIDIKTAFLHGELEENVFMQQPEGYVQSGSENKVCKLNRAIYGLKQAARAWNQKVAEILKNNDFKQSKADPCLFTKTENNDDILIILYVDDILIASKNKEKIDNTLNLLEKSLEVKNLGDVKHYLGICIKRNEDGSFQLNQKNKIEELQVKFNISGKPTYIPMDTSYLREADDTKQLEDNSEYRKAIGALLYITTISRPDIAVAVSLLSRKNENPTEKDWTAVIKVIAYLNTTKDASLIIDSKTEPTLTAYTDADWANDKTTRKSTSGNLFFVGNNLISWITKRQNCIALSSTESEYISAAQSSMEINWLIELLKDLGLQQSLPIRLYEDNKSCIILTQNNKTNSRTKHIDVKYHYIRDLQEKNIIQLEYCCTKQMIADIMTKPLPKPQFLSLRGKLNLKVID